MKKTIALFLGLTGMLPGIAQNIQDSDISHFVRSDGAQVASPNRNTFQSMAATSRLSQTHTGSTSALLIVDANGKTVGRAFGSEPVVISIYNNQLIGILGLSGYITGGQMAISGAMNWSPYGYETYYTSIDCSGPPLFPVSRLHGTPYIGVVVRDAYDGPAQIAVINASNVAQILYGSTYSNGPGGSACRVRSDFPGTYPLYFAPAEAIIPASTFGTPPFWLK